VNSSGVVWLGAALIFLTACGGNSAKTTPPTTYTISGAVTGLVGTGLVLQDNGGNNLPVNGNGSFLFSTVFAIGSAYNVTVLTQPSNPTQSCAVQNGVEPLPLTSRMCESLAAPFTPLAAQSQVSRALDWCCKITVATTSPLTRTEA
jgi:hypothetical protein